MFNKNKADQTGKKFAPNALATGIGSLPHKDPHEACELVWKFLPDIPFWPQLPKRSPLENMYRQYSEGMPSVVIKKDGGFYIQEEGVDFYKELERFYQGFLSEDLDYFKISRESAQGFYAWMEAEEQLRSAIAIKGHITGPISFGLQVTQSDKRSILYNDTLMDVVSKQLLRKAQWQLSFMKKIHNRTIIFIDEPYLSAFGSAFTNIDGEKVVSVINEIISGIDSLTAIHCCGNTDWSLVLDTNIDILSFDAYSFMDSLFLFEDNLKRFLSRGGIIAWGIVPTDESLINNESIGSILSRLEKGWERLAAIGIDQENIISQSIITPACGLGTLSIKAASDALLLLNQVSSQVRGNALGRFL